jgi:hypothetical protein
MPARKAPVLLALAALAAACAAGAPQAQDPVGSAAHSSPGPSPPPFPPATSSEPSAAARQAIESLLGHRLPDEVATPLSATRAEIAEDLVEELRPQVDRLHPGSSRPARETWLHATARASAASVVARYSPARKRILVAGENLLPQMEAAGLATDPATIEAFLTVVLAHEMVHARDDAVRGILFLLREAPDAEAVRALGMHLEGRAVHYARVAAERLGLPPAVAAVLPAARGALDEGRARWLLTYREGAAFVAALEARGGRELAESALREPPRRTGTLFHPERFGPGGEEPVPDLAARLEAAGIEGAAAASELDLRARWLPVLGEERTAAAFAGFRAGAGIHRPDGGVSASVHGTAGHAEAYAAALRVLYGMEPGAAEGSRDGLALVVLVRGRAVASALAPSPGSARRDAARALDAVPGIED